MKAIKTLLIAMSFFPLSVFAWQWLDLWQTKDQQGSTLLQSGEAQKAAQIFKNKDWQGVSHYRAGNYKEAFEQFSANKTSDGQYNAGNAAAFMGRYQEAITAYDKAIALNPNHQDAITNREIIKKLLQQKPPQQQQEQSSSQSNKDDKSQSNAEQKNAEQNSKQQNQADKQKEQQQNPQTNKNHPSTQNKNQANQSQQKAGEEKQSNASKAASNEKQQDRDENNKQLLRRLSDDPGGLMQQKFLRDYARRHGVEVNED